MRRDEVRELEDLPPETASRPASATRRPHEPPDARQRRGTHRPGPARPTDERKLRGLVPYGVETRDLGGWREVIDPGALDGAQLDDLIATVDHDRHAARPHPTTLELEDRDDGLHWSVEPARVSRRRRPRSGRTRRPARRLVADGRRARRVGRRRPPRPRDRRAAATSRSSPRPAYAAAAVELRSQPDPAEGQEDTMADTARDATEHVETNTEDRAAPAQGGLQVEDRVTVTNEPPARARRRVPRTPGSPARPPRSRGRRSRTAPSPGPARRQHQQAPAAPPATSALDQRYAWPAFARVNVDAGATSVDVFTQTARTLADRRERRPRDRRRHRQARGRARRSRSSPRAMKQVAAIYTNVPNIQLEQPAFNTRDRARPAARINEGLDKLSWTTSPPAGSRRRAPTRCSCSIRKAMTTIMAAGYNPDTLLLTPANAEALDVLVVRRLAAARTTTCSPRRSSRPNRSSGSTSGSRRRSRPRAVVDCQALGKLYTSPGHARAFRGGRGTTNRGNVRMELNAVFGGERTAAAVRIAAA